MCRLQDGCSKAFCSLGTLHPGVQAHLNVGCPCSINFLERHMTSCWLLHCLASTLRVIRRWRRWCQWGAGPSHPQATTSDVDAATAPVDIEQPPVFILGSNGFDEAAASSSGSHSALDNTQPAVGLGTTPVNFPGMHYTRSTASRLSAVVCPTHDSLHASNNFA